MKWTKLNEVCTCVLILLIAVFLASGPVAEFIITFEPRP